MSRMEDGENDGLSGPTRPNEIMKRRERNSDWSDADKLLS